MTHALTRLHAGGHIYLPGGFGEREYDITPHLIGSEQITVTRDLPGFVENGVTYESHHFWVHFTRYEKSTRFANVFIRVHHGGGWEVWRGDYMLARALENYGPDDRGLFLLCWFLIDAAKAARDAGAYETGSEYRKAFVDGRLKKRKLPAQGKVKVWIEPPQVTQ
jgi:hypothetical protein